MAGDKGKHTTIKERTNSNFRSPLGGKAAACPDIPMAGFDASEAHLVEQGAPPPADHLAMIAAQTALLPAIHAGGARRRRH